MDGCGKKYESVLECGKAPFFCPDCVAKLEAEAERLAKVVDVLEENLINMVNQHCPLNPESGRGDDVLDSCALSANRDAIDCLVELGKMEVVGERFWRRVFARFVPVIEEREGG